MCAVIPILPDNWHDYVSEKCGFLGCKKRAPLVWMTSGIVVGGLPEWAAECEKKYGIRIAGVEVRAHSVAFNPMRMSLPFNARHLSHLPPWVAHLPQFSTWPKVASENLAAAMKKATNVRDSVVGTVEETGAEKGLAISEELQNGNLRYLASAGAESGAAAASVLPRRSGLLEPAATVLVLTPLPASAHALLDCPEESLFVVPCTPVGIEELVLGNAEFGCIAHKTRCVVLLGAVSPDLATYVQAAKDAKLARDSPLTEGQRAVFERMLPSLSRVLEVAPPRCSSAEVERLCLEEWIRESSDELLRSSAVLAELCGRQQIHIERGVCGADGGITFL